MLACERILSMTFHRHQYRISVKSSTPPSIEFDQSVLGWYIRFSKAKVAKTISSNTPRVTFAIDLDSQGEVIGVELLGIKEFTISMLRNVAKIDTSKIDFTRARFFPTRSEKELAN